MTALLFNRSFVMTKTKTLKDMFLRRPTHVMSLLQNAVQIVFYLLKFWTLPSLHICQDSPASQDYQ